MEWLISYKTVANLHTYNKEDHRTDVLAIDILLNIIKELSVIL